MGSAGWEGECFPEMSGNLWKHMPWWKKQELSNLIQSTGGEALQQFNSHALLLLV